jgi:hypothetical protein
MTKNPDKAMEPIPGSRMDRFLTGQSHTGRNIHVLSGNNGRQGWQPTARFSDRKIASLTRRQQLVLIRYEEMPNGPTL